MDNLLSISFGDNAPENQTEAASLVELFGGKAPGDSCQLEISGTVREQNPDGIVIDVNSVVNAADYEVGGMAEGPESERGGDESPPGMVLVIGKKGGGDE